MSGEQSDSDPIETTRQQTAPRCSGGHSLTDQEVAADVQTLAALGNDTRYEALRIIAAADDEICVCELEPSLGVSQGAISQALSRLFSVGLIERRKEGRWRYYTATSRAERLLRSLDATRALATDE